MFLKTPFFGGFFKIIDVLGRDINNYDKFILELYDDGSIKKNYIIE